jgi:hypothetical protein
MSELLITNPGHWPKGVSGNPLGRPRGARNRTTVASEALLEGEAETLTRKAIMPRWAVIPGRCGSVSSVSCRRRGRGR